MRRHVIIGGLLLIGLGVILGATVFRTDIAQATGLAQAVTVSNTRPRRCQCGSITLTAAPEARSRFTSKAR